MTSTSSTSSPSTTSTWARWRTRASTSSTRATCWPITDTATDADFDDIAGVVAHEYFHNWSGNRVTCRDWFQLSLKEGFTVFRDQSFSADIGIGRGQAHRGRAPAARRAVPGGQRAAGAPGAARQLHGDHQLLHGDHLQQGRRADPHDAHDARRREVPRRHRPLFRAARRPGGDLRRFRQGAGGCQRRRPVAVQASGISQAGTPQVEARLEHDAEARTATLHLEQRVAADARASRPSSRCRSRCGPR